jgi:NADP-dependent 3-hydroxy acid dehydrogenase YdfG
VSSVTRPSYRIGSPSLVTGFLGRSRERSRLSVNSTRVVKGVEMCGIEGKVVVITGASSGIGEATGRLLAERGAAVVLGARRIGRLDELAGEIRQRGGQAVTCVTDVARRADLDRLIARAVATFGRLDVLLSNAGISKIGPLSGLDVDGWSTTIDVNLRGVLYGIAAALPVFSDKARVIS